MASAPLMSVPVDCLNPCNLSRGDGSRRYECIVLSCTWKAPRVLTGFLASTAQPQCSSLLGRGGLRRRRWHTKSSCRRCEGPEIGDWCTSGEADYGHQRRLFESHVLTFGCKRCQLHCSSSSSSEPSNAISPETLWEDLKPTISYLPPDELTFVHDALKLVFEAHDGQKRRSGEPFIIHPVEVARILGELELDWESISAGLLHDTVEDTDDVTFERIEKEFGATVRHIVEGETKVSKLGKLQCSSANNSVQDVKANDLKQMFLAMTQESELENLSFLYTNAHDHAEIKRRVSDLYIEHEKELVEAKKILIKRIEDDQLLDLVTVRTEVRSICEELYSLYKSVKKSGCSINEIHQVAQLCIIVKPKPCIGVGPLCTAQQICYHVLGLVHEIWTPIPRSMKDYISTPKPNGYQSLHTTVIPFLYESVFRVEVQIRTEEMDLIAERGIAAHYSGRVFVTDLLGHVTRKGKNSRGKPVCLNNANTALRIGWLNAIREWQEEFLGNMSSREFVDAITKDLLGSRVFVFTPKGEIRNLPEGATVIDYAYMIHTEIGNKMVAAKVNGNMVSPTHVLANAEVVEIVTYDAQSSKSAFERHCHWSQHAKTRSARHKIMKFLREQAGSCAAEITAEAVKKFVADSYDRNSLHKQYLDTFAKEKKTIINVAEGSNMGINHQEALHVQNGVVGVPKVNGKHNMDVQHVSLKGQGEFLSQGNGIAKLIHANVPMYKEVMPGLENWRASKVESWHNHEGHSIQWFCVVCIDRRGMMAEITSVMSCVGISIMSCVAEIDKRRGMGVLLFHIEGDLDSLVKFCSQIDLILGVLGWSAGCTWPCSSDNYVLEC